MAGLISTLNPGSVLIDVGGRKVFQRRKSLVDLGGDQ